MVAQRRTLTKVLAKETDSPAVVGAGETQSGSRLDGLSFGGRKLVTLGGCKSIRLTVHFVLFDLSVFRETAE